MSEKFLLHIVYQNIQKMINFVYSTLQYGYAI